MALASCPRIAQTQWRTGHAPVPRSPHTRPTDAHGSNYHVASGHQESRGRSHPVCNDRATGKRNALLPEMLDAISAAVRSADDNPEVRAVIVHGEGPMFSAGIDISALGGIMGAAEGRNPARMLRRLADRLQDGLNTLEATELPVIGALHGGVMGLGLELALAFDLRVATSDCQLSIPESRVGLVADVGGTTRLGAPSVPVVPRTC